MKVLWPIESVCRFFGILFGFHCKAECYYALGRAYLCTRPRRHKGHHRHHYSGASWSDDDAKVAARAWSISR